jgi:hypothetical protein
VPEIGFAEVSMPRPVTTSKARGMYCGGGVANSRNFKSGLKANGFVGQGGLLGTYGVEFDSPAIVEEDLCFWLGKDLPIIYRQNRSYCECTFKV